MEKLLFPLLISLVGGAIGGYIQTIFSYKEKILSDIWARRFTEYKAIWEISGVLPKYPEDRSVTYKKMHETCIKIKDWYFKNGGILMSKESRAVYEDVQKTLSQISASNTDEKLSDKDYDLLQSTFSLFRSKLTRDLTSRNRSLINLSA